MGGSSSEAGQPWDENLVMKRRRGWAPGGEATLDLEVASSSLMLGIKIT